MTESPQMLDQEGIQSTQYIIDFLENSKLQSDETLDSLPGIYAVIDDHARILRGNWGLADIFKTDIERLLSKEFPKILQSEDAVLFNKKLEELKTGHIQAADIKVAIPSDSKTLTYVFYMVPLKIKNRPDLNLFSVSGRDVTELTQTTAEKTRMQMELNTARIVQETFLPTATTQFGTSSISGCSDMATECGGDWWGYSNEGQRVRFYIGDVTGHGVPAALVVSAIHASVPIVEHTRTQPKAILETLNSVVAKTSRSQLVMTFLCGTVDLASGKFKYASAGHEALLLLRKAPGSDQYGFEVLQGKATHPLGSQTSPVYTEMEMTLQPQDRLFFYTDGACELTLPSGQFLSRRSFYRNVAKIASVTSTPAACVSEIQKYVHTHRIDPAKMDDATFFVFEF